MATPAEVEHVQDETARAWTWLESVVADVTSEQATWQPPGTANSIGASYLHTVINPDVELGRMLHRRVPLIESRFGGDVGQGFRYDPERFDDWPPDARCTWERMREYGMAVHSLVIELVEGLTVADLERDVDMSRSGLGMWQGRDLWVLHGWRHVYMHGGEISCLKGLQGATGYPRSVDMPRPASS